MDVWLNGSETEMITLIQYIYLSFTVQFFTVCEGWAFQVIDGYLTKGMTVGTLFYGKWFLPCMRFVIMVNY